MSEFNFLNFIIARLDGQKLSNPDYRDYIERLVSDGICGFILFDGIYEEVKDFISYLKSISRRTLIIASDIERGVGQQIAGATLIPSQMAIAAGYSLKYNKEELEQIYAVLVNEARTLGINLALTPVLDINTEPQNPIICTRAFSDDPKVVSKYGCFFIKFLESHGLATCGKHFPGHGSTTEDSHLTLPTIQGQLNLHLKPFKDAILSGVSTIMVGHISVFRSVLKPASLSERIIKGLLRKRLGFSGLVITDAMNMKALSSFKKPHALAFKAGADLILHPEDPYLACQEMKKAYAEGIIKDSKVKETIKRLKNFTEKLKANEKKVFKLKLNKLNLDFFKNTVTVVKNELKNLNSIKFTPYLIGSYNPEIRQTILEHFGLAFDLKKYKTHQTGIPLVAVFTDIGFGKKYSITEDEIKKIKYIISNKDAMLVSFGNPYVVRNFKEAKTIVLVYDSHRIALTSFLEVLKQGLNTKAQCPVKIFDEK